ncbi:hypothetical protein H6F86_24985 [Phormidium sp. FACHB-592]|uniref:Uncharacterized protein n=1 Tax=Stenomitos frigidus AS-A4 TaxID=2933935 RepID=A0ABV0KMI2_9CYAN|nr:hypothetical protein [Phormidium sp. FACHB-592]MBD2077081.1 hypothetical protein [Phormidium sp. FACHB-592]
MKNSHNRLFHLACKAAKYFFVGLFGVVVTGLLTAAFGIFHIFVLLLPWLWSWLLRLGITISCLLATAVIVESLSS